MEITGVESDQMVLRKSGREAGPHERQPKATQGGPSGSSPLRSDGSLDCQAGRPDPVTGAKDTQN
jgi:hypothetical protein